METTNTKTSYAYTSLKLTKPFSATTLCTNRINQLFCADWDGGTGNLNTLSVGTNQWNNLGGAFQSEINQICADGLGNIYVVGDQNANKQYVIKVYNVKSNQWSTLTDANGVEISHANPINFVCVDGVNNVYYTGNFEVDNEVCIMIFNASTRLCSPITGGNFGLAITKLCINSAGSLYASWTDNNNNFYINRWGGSWISVNFGNTLNLSTFAIDNQENIYLVSDNKVYTTKYPSTQLTDMNANLPDFTGTQINYIYHNDGILYVAGFGFESGSANTSCYVFVYNNGTWSEITPSDINANNQTTIKDLISYVGNNKNVLVSASNSIVYDGKSLIH